MVTFNSFTINSIAKGLAKTISNEGGLPTINVSGEICGHAKDIKKYIPENLWSLIILRTFQCLIADNVDLSAIGNVCINLKGLDVKDKFPFHEAIDICFNNDRNKLVRIVNLFEIEVELELE